MYVLATEVSPLNAELGLQYGDVNFALKGRQTVGDGCIVMHCGFKAKRNMLKT